MKSDRCGYRALYNTVKSKKLTIILCTYGKDLTGGDTISLSHNLSKSAHRPPRAVCKICIARCGRLAKAHVYVDYVCKVLAILAKYLAAVDICIKAILESKRALVLDHESLNRRVAGLPVSIIEYLVVGIILKRYVCVANLVGHINLKSSGLDDVSCAGYGISKPCKGRSNEHCEAHAKCKEACYKRSFS